jgi:hypothetical protein
MNVAMTCGVLYMVWGEQAKQLCQRSVQSLQQQHPELPFKILELPPSATLLEKALMFDASPWDATLFLDADTVVLGRLDYAFQKAEQFGLACCINETPWARRYASLSGDSVEYNTGVLFWSRKAEAVFRAWEQHVGIASDIEVFIDGRYIPAMPRNDQAGFAKAVEVTGFNPFVLPLNWNWRPLFQPMISGTVKIWHDTRDVMPHIGQWNSMQSGRHINFMRVVQDNPTSGGPPR